MRDPTRILRWLLPGCIACIALLGYEVLILGVPSVQQATSQVQSIAAASPDARSAGLRLAVALIAFAAQIMWMSAGFAARGGGAIIWSALVMAGITFEHSLFQIYGIFSQAERLLFVWHNADAPLIVPILESQIYPPSLGFALLMVLAAIGYRRLTQRPQRANRVLFLLSMLQFAMLLLVLWARPSTDFAATAITATQRSLARMVLDLAQLQTTRPEPARAVVPQRPGPAPVNNIVLIIDESITARNLSINGYARQTTPVLEALAKSGVLTNWGIGVSGATCSVASNQMLLTGTYGPGDDIDAFRRRLFSSPTLFQFAKAAGFTTWQFDAQTNRPWLGRESDRTDIDHVFGVFDLQRAPAPDLVLAAHDNDRRLARVLRNTLNTSSGNFIWVNKAGIHVPYHDKLPASQTIWGPGMQSPTDRDPQRQRNSYDSALRYNLDSFFSELIDQGLPDNTIVLYTSDHGQTLGENGETWSHCQKSRLEAEVPIFVLGRHQGKPHPSAAHHQHLHAAVLQLMNFTADDVRPFGYATSMLDARTSTIAAKRSYFHVSSAVAIPNGLMLGEQEVTELAFE